MEVIIKNKIKQFAYLCSAYISISLLKVILAKITEIESINVVDVWLLIQIIIFVISFWVLNREVKTFLIFAVAFIPIVLLSIYFSFILWLEIGLPY